MPPEIAIAVPNSASSAADPQATQRLNSALRSDTMPVTPPTIKATPNPVSEAVAAHARYGIVHVGMKEFTSAVYSRKPPNLLIPGVPCQIPNREATADRNAAPSATRAYNTASAVAAGLMTAAEVLTTRGTDSTPGRPFIVHLRRHAGPC